MDSSSKAGRLRWIVAFVFLLLAASAVPVLAQAPPTEWEPLDEGYRPSASDLDELPTPADTAKAIVEVKGREKVQRELRESVAAKLEREDARHAYADISTSEATALLSKEFASELAAIDQDPARSITDASVERVLGVDGAILNMDGKRALLDGVTPVRVRTEDGELAKVDLRLFSQRGGFAPANPLTELTLPNRLSEGIELGTAGVTITPDVGEGGAVADRFGEKDLVYFEANTDTDLLTSPVSSGVELFAQLRSVDSPEELRFDLDLPAGSQLHSDGSGGAEVSRDDALITKVPAPMAVDAQGAPVPVEMEVEGESLFLHVAHRAEDFAYPILVDPLFENWIDAESWFNGHGLSALDPNGTWTWWTNNGSRLWGQTTPIYAKWGGSERGLFISATSTSGWQYGGTDGYWTYDTPGGPTAYIQQVAVNPFWRNNHENCPIGEYYVPLDYNGIWSPSLNRYITFHLNDANYSGWSMNSPNLSDPATWTGRRYAIGMSTWEGGPAIPCWRDIYAGGVSIYLNDQENPTLNQISGVPSGWVSDKTALSINAQASDPGLGIRRITVLNEGKGVVAEDPVGHCTGLKASPCPSSRSAWFGPTGNSFGEGIRGASVIVEDAIEKTASSNFQIKVDRSSPVVNLEGQLAEATNEEGSEEPPPKEDEAETLSLPVYKLDIKATDGSTTSDLTKRSGVKDIRVFLDEEEMEVPWGANQKCPQTSCAMEATYTLMLSKLQTAGLHTLEVTAVDFAGNEEERHVEFEYIPATGMKDEYVMHYFPLPDGEGNEEEEEHPARPELAVNVMNGNLVYRQKDVDVEGAAVDLEVERFYNSQLPTEDNTEWGDGWTLAQTPELEPEEGQGPPEEAELLDASGALEDGVELPTEAGGSSFDPKLQATIAKEEDGGYELTDATGESATSVAFNDDGRAEARRTEGYAKIDYAYQEGDLSEIAVDDPASVGATPPEEPLEGGQEAPAYVSSFGGAGSGPGKLSGPAGITTDAEGNVWVADTDHNRIQEFSPYGEFLRQFGAAGSGEGRLSAPRGIVFDSAGDLWVLDSGNNRLQKFTPKGEYLAQLGAKGSGNGQFSSPRGIAIDAEDNLWVADTYNHRVQEFDPQGNYLRQFGGKGASSGLFVEPKGIAIDGEGHVVVADTGNHRIQGFSPEGQFIGAFGEEGTEDGQFSKPASVVVDGEGNVWVGDLALDRIQEFDPEGQYLAQLGSPGNDSGQLSEPQGIVTDAEGNLWVADTDNDRVQEFATGEFILKFGGAGSEAGQLSYPNGIATDSEGNVWVADTGHHRIQEFGPQGEFIRQFGAKGSGPGQFSSPAGIAIDAEGNVWVADGGNYRVQELTSKGEFIRQLGGAWGSGNGQFKNLQGISTDAEGNVWVADTGNDRVQEFSPTGEFIRKFGAYGSGNGQFNDPRGIAVDAAGHVWVVDNGNDRIQELSSTGGFIGAFGEEGTENGQLSSPAALALDAEGNLWVADTGNDRIQEFDPQGEYLAQFGATGNDPGQLSEPQGITTDSEGNVWVADTYNHRVQEFATGEFILKFGGEGSEAGHLAYPSGVATDAKGNVWVADTGHNRIQEFGADGQFIRQFGAFGSGECQLSSPRAIALDAEGDIWVADSGNARLQEFGADGSCLSRFGSPGKENGQFGAGLSSLRDLAIDPAGHIWTVEPGFLGFSPTRVQEFSPAGEFIRAFGSEGTEDGQFKSPQGIATDAEGNLWVADSGNHRIQEFDSTGQFIGAFGEEGTEDGQLSSPSNLAFDADGHLWVTDSASDRIQEFTPEGEYLTQFGAAGSDEGQLSQPRGISVGSEGRIWVADSANDRVQEWQIPSYAPKHDSLYLSSLGAEGTEGGQLRHPAGVAVDSAGNLWVADMTNNRVAQFDQEGEFLATFGRDVNQSAVQAEGSEAERNLCTAASEDTCQAGTSGSADGQMNHPAAVAIDAAGRLWIADKGNHRVEEFSDTGEYLGKFGSAGTGNGQLSQAEGIAIDPKGDIWVADTYNGRLQKFDSEGKFTQVVGSYGAGEGEMGEPTGIDIGPGGNVWIADWQNNRVEVFDEDGGFVRQFGTWGFENGQFIHPDGLTVDEKGQVWVGDEGNDRVQAFTGLGEYITQFGASGSEEGQLDLHWPIGLATDSEGKLWIADSDNDRVQRWGVFNYVPADEPFVVDNDPQVDVEVSEGLVESVAGEAAGETSYEHEGELLSAADGPAGETAYEYDEAERLTKVTLPNGTWGAVVYDEASGRVKSVTVAVEGAEPKTTEFEYTDSTPRRTTVIPSDSPHVTYDIGPDGSVLKWWNKELPPLLDLAGTLYDNREKSEPINNGDYWLESQAKSAEGIASIEVVANGNTLVSEETCEQTEEPGIECADQPIIDEWITSTDLNAPGRLQLEVIATDRLGNSTAERFWVDIPEPPPPPPPGLPVPPKFQDILKFREEYGLEVVFPVANETERNERIFNLINAWYEGDPVARSTTEKWGVPLRPADVAEMEYRDQYVEQASNVIEHWIKIQGLYGTYAGYYVNHRQGGIIHIGFTSDQLALVNQIKTTSSLMAPSRIAAFEFQPPHALEELAGISRTFSEGLSSRPDIASLISGKGTDVADNRVVIEASNVGAVSAYIEEYFNPTLFAINYQPNRVSPERPAIFGPPRRVREADNRLLVGDAMVGEHHPNEFSGCTLNFGAVENTGTVKPDGKVIWAPVALIAGHCFEQNSTVFRFGRKANGELVETPIGSVTRRPYGSLVNGFTTDAEAIQLKTGWGAPRWIWISSGYSQMARVPTVPYPGEQVCNAGVEGGWACGTVTGIKEVYTENMPYPQWLWEVIGLHTTFGDSGGPVWDLRTGRALGSWTAGGKYFTPIQGSPIIEGGQEVGTAVGMLGAPGMSGLLISGLP